jgi:hypothetical protein
MNAQPSMALAPRNRYLTVTLTGRGPVRILVADWPLIARVDSQGSPQEALQYTEGTTWPPPRLRACLEELRAAGVSEPAIALVEHHARRAPSQWSDEAATTLWVRGHQDGRCLVYGTLRPMTPGAHERRAGYLIDDRSRVEVTMHKVAHDLSLPSTEIPSSLRDDIQRLLAKLPAEVLA